MSRKSILFNKIVYPFASLTDMIDQYADNHTDKQAVISQNEQITYSELKYRTNTIASNLQRLSVHIEDIVIIAMDKSINFICAVIGVMKSGGAFLLLDVTLPDSILLEMINQIDYKYIIGDGERFCSIKNYLNYESLLHSVLISENIKPDEHSLAYLLFTSGTTGKRKAAMIEYGGLVNQFWAWKDIYQIKETDMVLQTASVAFDVFISDIVTALCVGATLHIYPYNLAGKEISESDVMNLYSYLETYEITCFHFTPVILRRFMEYLRSHLPLSKLRLAVVGGDTWHAAEQNAFISLTNGQIRIVNAYGVTESTVDSTYFEGKYEGPYTNLGIIGQPFANTEIIIADNEGSIVDVGQIGEVYIAGYGVGRGYYHNESLTKARFIPNTYTHTSKFVYKTGDLACILPDGNIAFLGRSDRQVEVHSVRVELGEVEARIKSSGQVNDAAVIYYNKRLYAYIIANTKEVQFSRIDSILPAYMRPYKYIIVEELPITSNSKINVRELERRVKDSYGHL